MSFFYRSSPTVRDLMRLLFVLGCAIVFAFAISVYFIYYRSPTGSHKVEAVVLLGETLESLNYIDESTGTSARYFFDKITFQVGQEKPVLVDVKRYQQFLIALYGDNSLIGAEAEKSSSLFQDKNIAYLLLYVASSAGSSSPQHKLFQEIQILKDDYRVNLHGGGMKEEWAYFHHPHVGEKATKLLVEVKN